MNRFLADVSPNNFRDRGAPRMPKHIPVEVGLEEPSFDDMAEAVDLAEYAEVVDDCGETFLVSEDW